MRAAMTFTLVGMFAVLAAGFGGVAGQEPAAVSAFRPVPFARGLESPVLLTHAPGDPKASYVVEQPGRLIRLASGRRTVFLDVTRQVEYSGEQGLLGLAFHPSYARNRFFYIGYTSSDGRNVVARYRSRGAKAVPSSRKILLSVPDPYGNHNGGYLAFGRDGMLYTTIGDGGRVETPRTGRRTWARSSESCFGSMSRKQRRGGRSRGSACETPGGSRSTAQPATSTSATWARAQWKR